MKPPFALIACLFFAPIAALRADSESIFTSGPERISLIELYTSEGCSSCPPAEKWLSDLQTSEGLWKKFVPIAFHVTYWNYLGWTDETAQESFNDRQRRYASNWQAGSVYTPCFVRNGEEWHRTGDQNTSEKVGTLTLKKLPSNEVEISFQPLKKANYDIHLATIGGGIETKVRAGENAGRTLQHDFVALSLQDSTLQPGDVPTAKLKLPTTGKNSPPRTGLVAWVTEKGELRPVQAVGGWLTP